MSLRHRQPYRRVVFVPFDEGTDGPFGGVDDVGFRHGSKVVFPPRLRPRFDVVELFGAFDVTRLDWVPSLC